MPRQYFGGNLTDEDCSLLARIEDLSLRAEKSYTPTFSHFLTPHEQAVLVGQHRVTAMTEEEPAEVFCWGGYPGAERTVFCANPCALPLSALELPFMAVTLRFPPAFSVGHRDVLGSLMGLGLKREAVGDILVGEGLAVLFLLRPAADFVTYELTKIGRVGVTVTHGAPEILPAAHILEPHSGTVASMRLDCMVALFLQESRTTAARLIAQRAVQVNAQELDSASAVLEPGDVVSIRGYGKFLFSELSGTNQRGRFRVNYQKYC